jgi:hypothetical protein
MLPRGYVAACSHTQQTGPGTLASPDVPRVGTVCGQDATVRFSDDLLTPFCKCVSL